MNRKGFLFDSHPWLQLLFLLGVTLVSILVCSAISMIAAPLFGVSFADLLGGSAQNIDFLKFMQIFQSTGMFIIPPVVYFMAMGNGRSYLFKNKKQLWILVIIALAIGIFSTPIIDLTHQWNQQMQLPKALGGVEQWMADMEQQLKELTASFLKMDSWADFLVNMLMIAIIPAIGEELMFRGALQKIFSNWTRNPHIGIFLTALLFSAIHMQFYGFLPRFLLGYLFGYLFYWSGNIWVPIAAHFLNNGTVVVLAFLFQQKISTFDIEKTQTLPLSIYIVSLVLTIALLRGFFKTGKTSFSQSGLYGKRLGEDL